MAQYEKSLQNTTAGDAHKNVSDLIVWGDGDMFKLLCKAHSKEEGWMKSTKAMEIHGVGCVVQVTTQQGDNVAEAVCFVPGVEICPHMEDGFVVSRSLDRIVHDSPSQPMNIKQ